MSALLEPYARAVVDALRADDITVNLYSAMGGSEPHINIALDADQCWRSGGYTERICLVWNPTAGWGYGVENVPPDEGFLWFSWFGGQLLPTPAEMVVLVNSVVFHVADPEPCYRDADADDDLPGQLDRATRGRP